MAWACTTKPKRYGVKDLTYQLVPCFLTNITAVRIHLRGTMVPRFERAGSGFKSRLLRLLALCQGDLTSLCLSFSNLGNGDRS